VAATFLLVSMAWRGQHDHGRIGSVYADRSASAVLALPPGSSAGGGLQVLADQRMGLAEETRNLSTCNL
jgi:hypothetical protein